MNLKRNRQSQDGVGRRSVCCLCWYYNVNFSILVSTRARIIRCHVIFWSGFHLSVHGGNFVRPLVPAGHKVCPFVVRSLEILVVPISKVEMY